MNALIGLIQAHGLPFVFLIVALEQMGLPLPAFPALILAGALSVDDGPAWYALLTVSVLACVLSDVIWYTAGRRYGTRVLHLLCRISVTPDQCVSQTQNYFNLFGPKSLLVAKFIPGFNTIAPPLAGATGISAERFIFYTLLGSALWGSAALSIGWYLQDRIGQVLVWLERFSTITLSAIAAMLVLYVAQKVIRRRAMT